ncbi:hypothetical protein VF21_07600 [Pseudogymnoascus sp. 05NY08]|nr:hypothetical protein VF21_07600 [Pseudogymnoascus sp. 05NY08]
MPSPCISIASSNTTPSDLPAEPPAKKSKLTASDFEIQRTVIFIVGKDKRMLQMPRRAVCESSELIYGEFKDFPDTSLLIKEFPNVSVEIFTLFLVWLSTGDLNNAEHLASPLGGEISLNLQDTTEKLGQLIQCYNLSEELVARPFQNYITDQICDYLERLVDMDGILEKTIVGNIPLLYGDGPKESKLKCLLEDAIVTRTMGLARFKIANIPEHEPMVSEFWNGVAITAIQRIKELEAGRMRFPLNWGEEERCKYHEHKNDDEVEDCREKRLGGSR